MKLEEFRWLEIETLIESNEYETDICGECYYFTMALSKNDLTFDELKSFLEDYDYEYFKGYFHSVYIEDSINEDDEYLFLDVVKELSSEGKQEIFFGGYNE
jgi:hypothetical protein